MGLPLPRFVVRNVLPRLHGVARTRSSIHFPLWMLTMPRKSTRRLFGTFVALIINWPAAC